MFYFKRMWIFKGNFIDANIRLPNYKIEKDNFIKTFKRIPTYILYKVTKRNRMGFGIDISFILLLIFSYLIFLSLPCSYLFSVVLL